MIGFAGYGRYNEAGGKPARLKWRLRDCLM